jgi:predicted metal-dependent hydrolase
LDLALPNAKGCANLPGMSSRTIYIDGVGPILLERSKRAKYIGISIKPFQGIRVAVPLRVSFLNAEGVARSKIHWMKKHLKQMTQQEECARQIRLANPVDPAYAVKTLIHRTTQLANRYRFEYNRVVIRRQRTRWGSCSINKNIYLNIHLIQLPEALIDYVILHELVHTRVRNHGRRFWDELAKYIDTPKKCDRELNAYSVLLTDPDGL